MRTIAIENYTPKTGDYKNMIVVDKSKALIYMYDCDGVYSKFISSEQQGATKTYVDNSISQAVSDAEDYTDNAAAQTLQDAKDYTDQHSGQGGVTQQYVDDQDAATLQLAKDYADVQDVATLNSATGYTDSQMANVGGDIDNAIQSALATLAPVALSGSYSDLSGKPVIPVITMTDTDPGEGVLLEANHFIAVYQTGGSE